LLNILALNLIFITMKMINYIFVVIIFEYYTEIKKCNKKINKKRQNYTNFYATANFYYLETIEWLEKNTNLDFYNYLFFLKYYCTDIGTTSVFVPVARKLYIILKLKNLLSSKIRWPLKPINLNFKIKTSLDCKNILLY